MELTDRYKLVKVYVENYSRVIPVDEHGRDCAGVLTSFENDDDYYYAIYENTGTKDSPTWQEFDYFEQDFEKALEGYRELQHPTKKYELTVLLRQDCDTNAERDKIYHQIKLIHGHVLKDEDDGVKRLAYEINNEAYADYRYFSIRLVNGDAVKLSNWLNTQNNILRYLLVQDDNRKD